jgi:phospholipase C
MDERHRIEHIFVLMLENRSFDHLLGFSGLQGADAETGQPTTINGLDGIESNNFNGHTYPVTRGADLVMPADPGHEFPDILHQLCGINANYPRGGPYPPINNSGYVASYAATGGSANPGEIMNCFTPAQLPVLTALAHEFALCDNWHASMPGPTWPNRMFLHAGSSGGLDHSPTWAEIVEWELGPGYSFLDNTIFDNLRLKDVPFAIYGGDFFPMVSALRGINPLTDVRQFNGQFATDLQNPSYPFSYIFIEPRYDVLFDYRSGNSQHPLNDVRAGELLLKTTYETIRNSPHWESSLLIVTWDENGGFFDHAIPPAAMPPGDSWQDSKYNQNGFLFDRYGPRVPAVVISPLIPHNVIDHRLYDHTSVLATIEHRFGIVGMTNRDRSATPLLPLVQLSAPRFTPVSLPDPAPPFQPETLAAAAIAAVLGAQPVDKGSLPAILYAALQQDLKLSPQNRQQILEQVKGIRTRAGAAAYLQEVEATLASRKP